MSEMNVLQVVIQNAYNNHIYDKQLIGTYTTINGIMNEVSRSCDLADNLAISIYDRDLYCYVYCGIHPLDKVIHIEETDKVIICLIRF
jgi:hypothetical protein